MRKAKIPFFNLDVCFRCCSSKARVRRERFNIGSEKISQHMDVVNFIEQQITIATLLKLQFGRVERFLSRHQYKATVLSHKDQINEDDLVVREFS